MELEKNFLRQFSFDISPFVSIRTFDSVQPIVVEGEPPAFLYYMSSGRAKLYTTQENGRVSLIDFLGAPCFIGEMELLREDSLTRGVTAILPCRCYAVDMARCRGQLLSDPIFLRGLCLQLSRRLQTNTTFLCKNTAYPLENRLAAFILLTETGGFYRERHTEVSEYLGVSYRHLLYVLAAFVREGILEKTTAGYRIINRSRLQELA